jgi:hypothetical protein
MENKYVTIQPVNAEPKTWIVGDDGPGKGRIIQKCW